MAEHVQEALDRMVAPLKDLMERQIFTEHEIKAIVSRRRESEYLLRRLTARKADFLRYIQAEQDLERLRQLRTKQRKRDHLKSKSAHSNKEEQNIGDAHIIQHLHLLFVRAIRKFRSDLSLHLLHADFCKEMKSYSRLGRVYTEALQVFPRQSGLWIEAASHEFFGPTRSIRNARILLQRGLRFNKTSEDLWCESFSLELHYAQTLRGRKQILAGGAGSGEGELEESNYKIAKVIYKNAIQAIPDSIRFRLRLLDICRRFPSTEELMEMIQVPLEKDFQSSPEAWLARALFVAEKQNGDVEEDETNDRPSKKTKTNDAVIIVLEKAIETLPNEDMYLQAFRFARNYQNELRLKGSQDNEVEKFYDRLFQVMSGHSSSDLAMEHADFLMESGQNLQAENCLKEFCSKQKSTKADPWIHWAGLSSSDEALSILTKALEYIPLTNSEDHMKVLLQLFGCQLSKGQDDVLLFDTFQRILLLAPSNQDLLLDDIGACESFGLQSVAHACLKYLQHAETLGIKAIRRVYSKVLFSSSLSINETNVDELDEFVERCVKLERNDRTRIRRLYDKAIQLFQGTPLEDSLRLKRNKVF